MGNIRPDLPATFPHNVLAVLDDLDIGMDGLWPHVPSGSEEGYFLVACGDFFDDATADAEPLAKGDWPLFLRTARELDEMDKINPSASCYLLELYAARSRRRKPLHVWIHGRSDGSKVYMDAPELIPLFESVEDGPQAQEETP